MHDTRKELKMLKPLAAVFLASVVMTGCTHSASKAPAPAELRRLIESIGQRLDIATDVAQSKFYSGKAVQDSERERQVIANAEQQASTYALDTEDVREFMTAQIEANKMVQYARIAQWHDEGPAPQKPTVTLTNGIRTRLDTLQPVMMQQFAAFKPLRTQVACNDWIATEIRRRTKDPILVTAMQRATSSLCLLPPKA